MIGVTNVSSEPAARFVLPDLIERGAANTLQCPLYQAGALVAPTSGTATVYDASDAVLSSGAVTVTGSVATFSVTPSSSLQLGEGWRVEWSLLVSGRTIAATNSAALCRRRLRCPVTSQDLYSRLTSLNPDNATVIHSQAHLDDPITAAWMEIQRRLVNKGNRPNLVLDPSSLYDAVLNLSMANVFDDFATRLNPAYSALAATWRTRYQDAWKELSFLYDNDDNGQAEVHRRPAVAVTFLGAGAWSPSWER